MSTARPAASPPSAGAETETAQSARLASVVEKLSSIDRRTTRVGEQSSAEWLAGQLESLGMEQVRLVSFRGHSTWAWANIAHALIGLVAAWRGGSLGRGLALGAIVSYELDYTARSQWLRRLLPAATGTSVAARLPARAQSKRTLVLVAHHDAAHCGLIWNPRALAFSRWVARRTGTTPSYANPIYLALSAIASGRKRSRLAGAGLLGLGIGLALQAARSETAPGANDNASGVAAVLELVRRLASERPDDLELRIFFPGGEEVGVAGMTAWARTEAQNLDPASTLVLNLDALGGGEPVVVKRESWTARYPSEDLDLVDRAADSTALPRPARVGLAVNTDAMVASHLGLPAVSMLSMRDGTMGRFHQPDDSPENVDWESVEKCLQLANAVIATWWAESA
jgi:acetylornithine deacetylase/succinyl-diaminopimelate desuccinylase-like protein